MPVKTNDNQQLSLYDTHAHTTCLECLHQTYRPQAHVSGVGTIGLAQASTRGYSET